MSERKLLVDEEFVLTIDSLRSVSVTPTDGGTAVIALEDPHTIAITEMGADDIQALIDGLVIVKGKIEAGNG